MNTKRSEPSDQEVDYLFALFNQARFIEGEAFARTLSLRYPRSGFVWKALGVCLISSGKKGDAVIPLGQAVIFEPADPEVHANLGVALKACGRLGDAESSYRRAIKLKPQFVEAHSGLAITLLEQGRLSDAERSCRRAIELNPTYAVTHNNLAIILKEKGCLNDAEQSCRRAIAFNQDFVEAHVNLGTALKDQGRLREAEVSYRRALELNPDCLDVRSNLLFAMNYQCDVTPEKALEEARIFSRHASTAAPRPYTKWTYAGTTDRLRVGIVSGDFAGHVVSYFLESVIAHVDPKRLELIAYSSYSRKNSDDRRLRPYFSEWKTLAGKSDEEAAQLIHADRVYILIDLSGHTAHNRLPLFSWKPAPVQVAWLGYFATTGVEAIDYILVDPVGVPQDAIEHFTEKVWYLPDTRLCFSAPPFDLPVAGLPALGSGLMFHTITFGCFQNLSKLGNRVLNVWSAILSKVPQSRLRLQCPQFDDPSVRAQMLERVQAAGISAEKVHMHGTASRQAYLEAYADVDIILDTFPFPGGTTTCEALWMGVPTVTLAGDTLLARQGASLLSAAGLSDWIAVSESDYIARVVTHSQDLAKLAALRARLREQVLHSPLFDAPRFACNLEEALWAMWHKFQHIDSAHVKF